jgi:hypothetical protein
MYYGLGQQAMRQDPKHFAIYCALRPDQNTNLVSYPYYAKYAHEGDNTFFRYIDVNVKQTCDHRARRQHDLGHGVAGQREPRRLHRDPARHA